jgi:uncharacterized protein (TIGR02680 family)
MTVPRTPRWRLHRGGIVNVWEFGEQVFDLTEGRAFFQGANGSGKSRTLELLLPLCLDGDFRNLGAKGYDTVSIKRLMLDDYRGGPNRIGYAWIELHRATADGGEEFLTSGVGVRASRASQSIADSWFFVTPQRIGIDLQLLSTDRVPLDQKDLRERIGADAVIDDHKVMQQRLATEVYGIEEPRRYEDLLHLLRTLRNPDVGVKAVEGQLEKYLSTALPPLDPEITRQLAVQFQDLETIRENLNRFIQAQGALLAFLLTYQQYAVQVMRERGRAVIAARTALNAHQKAANERAKNLATEQKTRADADADLTRLEAEKLTLKAQVDELSKSPEYSDISARRQAVDIQRQLAASALDRAAAHRSAEEMAAANVLSGLQHLQEGSRATNRALDDTRSSFGTASLAVTLLPALPAAPETEFVTSSEQIPVSVSSEEPLGAITRVLAPALNLNALRRAIRTAVEQSEHAQRTAREQHVMASNLLQKATALDAEYVKVGALRKQAEEAEQAREVAGECCRVVDAESTITAQGWLDQVCSWLAAVPDGNMLAEEPPVLPSAADLVSGAAHAESLRTCCQDWSQAAIREAHAVLAVAEGELRSLVIEGTALSEELKSRRAGADLGPPLPPHAAPDRAARPGAPFYQLVDFAASLRARERANLEAALQGSGLLNAWVTPGGLITDPNLQDLIAAPMATATSTAPGETLLAALVPTPDPDSAVAPETVTRLLASVRLADEVASVPADGLALSCTGHWRAGPLTGAWKKDTADHVGPSARRDSRLRRISALETLLEQWQATQAAQEVRVDAARASVDAWEQHVSAFPTASEVAIARSRLETAHAAEVTAIQAAEEATRIHSAADGAWQAKNAAFGRQASAADFPITSDALTERLKGIQHAIDALSALTSSLSDRYLPAVPRLEQPLDSLARAAATRRKSEADAVTYRDEHASAARALALYIQTLGFDSQEFDVKLSGLRDELKAVETEIPPVKKKLEQADTTIIKIMVQQERDAGDTERNEEAVTAQETSFDAALAVPGLWAAATGGQPPPNRDDALRTVIGGTLIEAAASQADLIRAFQALNSTLPIGHSAEITGDDGAMAILVTDGEGTRPVVMAAERTGHRLAEFKEQLDERYQHIFEDFLLHDLSERLRQQIDAAAGLCHAMNNILARAKSSQGIRVELSWELSSALDQRTRDDLALVRKSLASRTDEQSTRLRAVLRNLIEAERDKGDAHYSDVLTRALDYRNWFAFTVRVQDNGTDGLPRTRALRRLSSGETRVASYVTLFAAAAAFYDALDTAGSTPLRLVLLDEAFERVDDPTKTRLLKLLASLDIDWIITWPGGSVLSEEIGLMHIYNIFRPTGAPGMAFVHLTWNGAEAENSP